MKFELVKKVENVTIIDKETKKEKEITVTHFFLRSEDKNMKLIPILPNKKTYKNGASFTNADLLSYLAIKVD